MGNAECGFKRRGARQKIRNTKPMMILDLAFSVITGLHDIYYLCQTQMMILDLAFSVIAGLHDIYHLCQTQNMNLPLKNSSIPIPR
jgi:hypothetical protein